MMAKSPKVEITPGSLDDAVKRGADLLAIDPDAALRQAQVILKKDGREPRALRIAAAAHRARGEAQYAARAELLAIEEGRRYPSLRQAAKALEEGAFGEASKLAAQHLRAYPDDLAALVLSAESALGIGLVEKAIPLLRSVLARAPEFAHASVLLVNALMLSDQLAEARKRLDRLLVAAPDNLALLSLSNRLANASGDFDTSVRVTGEMRRLAETSPDILTDHGDALRFAGRRDEARSAYREALRLSAEHARSWWSLADLDAASITDDDIGTLRGLIESPNLTPGDQANLQFALAMTLHDRQKFDEAFEHFADGNAARAKIEPYAADKFHRTMMDRLGQLRSSERWNLATPAQDAPTPVFMVGMPRAGSTLLERMLSQYPAVEAMGELQIVPHMVARLEAVAGVDRLNEVIATLSVEDTAERGDLYRDRVKEAMRTDARVAIDKMHMNWRHLPLILRALPEARVIDIRRDPMDCCWSNFRTLFSTGHPASNSLQGIGRFYRTYAEFTDGVRELLPDRVMLVRFEELVDDPRRILSDVAEFIGIAYSDSMLDFHLSSAPVATASSEQVRRPLNRRGIGAWQDYSDHLGPLREALGGE